LDAGLQRHAEGVLRQQLRGLAERQVGNGAVLVLDNRSGDVLAWVANGGGSEVDGVRALRQAGSTLKPFLYALALERRLLTAASPLDDSALNVDTVGGAYVPQNYDRDFKGFVSVRTSLASSLNVPAVRTLMLTGLERFYERLQALGISSLTEAPDFYGPSLALGSADVSLLELTNAYRALANGGHFGAVGALPGTAHTKQRVFDAGAVFVIGDILADPAARSLTFGLRNELAVSSTWAAVKTGTSKDMRDNWCIGYSERYTVGVWVGNFDGAPMWNVSGVTGAAPVWRDVMDYLHQGLKAQSPAVPPGVVRQAVAFAPAFEPARGEWFLRGTELALVQLPGQAGMTPTILYPAEGSVLAIDPDIPAYLQRVALRAQAADKLAWRLDGVNLGSARDTVKWAPRPGPHVLALVDDAGQVVAERRFEVRGAADGAADSASESRPGLDE
jgi:penicillin-binding protein 1C